MILWMYLIGIINGGIAMATPPFGLWVDRHAVRSALATSSHPTFGWIVPTCDSDPCHQIGWEIQLILQKDSSIIWNSEQVNSNISDGVSYPADSPALQPRTRYAFRVRVWLSNNNARNKELRGTVTQWSANCSFLTALWTNKSWAGARPIWSSNAAASYVMFRLELNMKESITFPLFLAITAKPTPLWKGHPKNVNASKLLGAYSLWINGIPHGTGPGRNIGGAVNVDVYNITKSLRTGSNLVAVESFYGQKDAQLPGTGINNTDDYGGMIALIFSSNNNFFQPIATGNGQWDALDATTIFNGAGTMGTGNYWQPGENIDARNYPKLHYTDWKRSQEVVHVSHTSNDAKPKWEKASLRGPNGTGLIFADGLNAMKGTMPIALKFHPAKSFRLVNTNDSDATYHYIIDYGRNIQGGLNLTFSNSLVNHTVEVRLGEELNKDGSVRWQAASRNNWKMVWTLSQGLQTLVTHEYIEFRWAEIIGSPNIPELSKLNGWQVVYPFDGNLNENGKTSEDIFNSSFLTHFESSNSELDQVWELSKYTVTAIALDVNTDSNTRQRDDCDLDAYLTTTYQGGVAALSGGPYRKRVSDWMFAKGGYVNTWTEFQTSHIGAVYAYGMDYADDSLAIRHFDSMKPFSMIDFFNTSGDGLVHGTPKPLIDWPRSNLIDINSHTSRACDAPHACAAMNAHTAIAHRRMATMAHSIGREIDAMKFSQSATSIRQNVARTLIGYGEQCDPPSPVCFFDNLDKKMTTVQATLFPLVASPPLILSNQSALSFVPFLIARNRRRNNSTHNHGLECSPWAAGFLLRALYQMSGDSQYSSVKSPDFSSAHDAAKYAIDVLTDTGDNSWLSMMHQHNATMTMEAWSEAAGSGTFSHPWAAAPAEAIPRWLMGLRPLLPAFRRVTIHPLPPRTLKHTLLRYPTLRGLFEVQFDILNQSTALLSVVIPGNTEADVCVPAYIFENHSTSMMNMVLTLDGLPIKAVSRGALLCCPHYLQGGAHTVMLIVT